MKKKINKKAQITVFIILGLVLVGVIALIFTSIRGPKTNVPDVENPQAFIDTCTSEAVEEAVEILMLRGGDIEPKGTIMYNGENVVYLCYNTNYYKPCITQRPMLIKHIENEITDYIKPKVNNCFQSLKIEFEKKHYSINMKDIEITTELNPKEVLINIDLDFKITKNENTQTFDNFKTVLVNPIYDFAEIGNEISSQEAKYCYFNVNGFNSNYPEFEVRKDMISDSKIYIIGQRESNLNFIFAIRGCVMPAGF